MLITKTNPFDGKEYSLEIDITPEEYQNYLEGNGTALVLFPQLSADEREFLISGISPESWDVYVKEDSQEELLVSFEDDSDNLLTIEED